MADYNRDPSVSFLTNESCVSREQSNHVSEVKPMDSQDGDESDSGIFRVKRRSSTKMANIDLNDAASHVERQVLPAIYINLCAAVIIYIATQNCCFASNSKFFK